MIGILCATQPDPEEELLGALLGGLEVTTSTSPATEAVAYDDETMRFNSLLGLGEAYDFMRVGFAPTYIDRLHYIFCLCADYYVILSPQTMVNASQRTI
jgi:hypothetical protein